MLFRRFAVASSVLAVLAAVAACSASNGDAIPGTVFDASPLDAGENVPEPTGDAAADDASPAKDAAKDAPKDAPPDALPTNDVRINELFVDNHLLGDGAEFVELRAPAGTAVDDLRLRLVDHAGVVKADLAVGDPGDKVGAGGLWVVGGNQTYKLNVAGDHVDQVVALGSWGLDNEAGAVQLLRGTTVLDVVGYSTDADAGTVPPAATPPTTTVEGKPALVPSDSGGATAKRRSFGRAAGAVDTNDNRADFCAMIASPGQAQNACQ